MKIRNRLLPPGWYPDSAEGVRTFIESQGPGEGQGLAALSPHAGWYFAGEIACKAVASLGLNADTVVVAGGHLGAIHPVLASMEDAVDTPLGTMEIDADLRSGLIAWLEASQTPWKSDLYRDNSVEVLLPFVKYFFPRSRLLWLRVPPSIGMLNLGRELAELASAQKKKLVFLASSDLTHYGPNYDFTSHGSGKEALDWVRETNDAAFIGALCAGDAEAALERATRDQAACSSGAAMAALGFVRALGHSDKAAELAYATSADKSERGEVPESFVGYAALGWK